MILRSLSDLLPRWKRGAISIGNFDGVHRGHQVLIRQLVKQARTKGGPALVFTFDPHPAEILRPQHVPPPLTWIKRRAELLGQLGVDAVLAYPTDMNLLGLKAEDFFREVVVNGFAAAAMVEGPNFFFGKDRGGNVTSLRELCQRHDIDLEIVAPQVEPDGTFVSSSLIRHALSQGRLEQANAWLTHPYRIRGRVVAGEQRGRQLGFPTANLAHIENLIPSVGVYAGRVRIDRSNYPAAINIGPNPTFAESNHKVEVHLIDFDGDLYQQRLEVDFLKRLRDIQAFDSVSHLRRQLDIDVNMAKAVADGESS